MLAELAAPFTYDFMVKAMVGATAVGAICAYLSCFVTLRGWSLLGDALSHAVVPGVAIANLAAAPFALGAFATGLLAVVTIGLVERATALKSDAVIGVVFTTLFALGLAIISLFPSDLRLTTILFGNLLGIADADLAQMVAIALVSFGVVTLRWKDLFLFCFDPVQAHAVGLDTRRLNLLLLVVLSLVTVAALQAVGAILVVAMLITPGATAYLLTDRFARMLIIAPAIGGTTALIGTYLSFFSDSSVGGSIVVMQTLLFLAVLVLEPRRGLLAARQRNAA